MSDTNRDPQNIAHLRDPLWDKASKVHDWRNHVGECTRSVWMTFTDRQRLAIAEDAQARADMENWD